MSTRVVIVGNGIVGLATAFQLRRNGHEVIVVDRGPVDEGTSTGNAGGVAGADFLPIPEPGLWKRVPGYLLDPLGPLTIRWRDLPSLTPWLYRFLRACRPAAHARGIDAMGTLLGTALDAHLDMIGEAGLRHMLNPVGALFVYRSDAARAREDEGWAHRARHGVEFETLDRQGVLAREPALGPEAHCGYFVPGWAHYRNPRELVTALAAHLAGKGVEFRTHEVAGFEVGPEGPTALRLKDADNLPFDHLVVAAGAWSARLSALLGDPFPLVADRGYNTTLPTPGVALNGMITFAEDSFVVTPMSIGLRVGGAVELARPETPPNYERSKALVRLARRYLPDLDTTGGTEWMGWRPGTPDSVPVISRSSRHGNVFYVFGHGHLGLTGSPVSGRLIADMIAGRTPNIDMAPYRIDRYR